MVFVYWMSITSPQWIAKLYIVIDRLNERPARRGRPFIMSRYRLLAKEHACGVLDEALDAGGGVDADVT